MLGKALVFAAGIGSVVALAAARTESALTLQSVSVDLPQTGGMFPAGPGSDAINRNCLGCHSTDMVLNQPALPRAAWEAEVNKMISVYKAPVPATDIGAIVDYLTRSKGPKND